MACEYQWFSVLNQISNHGILLSYRIPKLEEGISMSMSTPLIALAAIIASTHPQTAFAQTVTDSFSYQGELMDDGGPANGLYDFIFSVRDAEFGGAAVPDGTVEVQDVLVTDGRFECFVDFGVTGVVFDTSDTRWLQIGVAPDGGGSFTGLSPRQRLAPTPHAGYAIRAGSTDMSLDDAYHNGNTIYADNDPVVIRDPDNLAVKLHLGSDGIPDEGAGVLTLFNEAGDDVFILGADLFEDTPHIMMRSGVTGNVFAQLRSNTSASGGGGSFVLARNEDIDVGISLLGNTGSSEAASIFVIGPDRTISLNTSEEGNDSVVLPSDAISAAEILDEVGAAEIETNANFILTPVASTLDTINTASITCPTDGYALVLATAQLNIDHIGGTDSSVRLGISDDPILIPSNSDIDIFIEDTIPTASLHYPVTVHQLFPVSAGVNTFYFYGDQNEINSIATVTDRQLTAVFIPTSYAAVPITTYDPTPDHQLPITPSVTPDAVASQRDAALRETLERQQRELDEMRAVLKEMQQQMQKQMGEQPRD